MSCFILCGIFLVAAILVLIKVWLKLTTGWCKSNVCLVGKTAIVTGANAGIGYETAADFAKRGAKVILACRDVIRGEDAKERIIRATENPNIHFKRLDLSSLNSVREFAKDINKTEERLDILVNNAGIAGVGYGSKETEDGLNILMQVNYYGHFLLTNLLLDLLKKSSQARIVNVSSIVAKFCSKFDVNKPDELLNVKDEDKSAKLYGRSKLCNILFTIELEKRLRNTSVTAYSLHPGVVLTSIFRKMPAFVKSLIENVIAYYFKDSLEGAQTTIYCSVEKNIEHFSGHHFSDCQAVGRYKKAQDPIIASQLWAVSEKLVKLN